MRGTVRAQAGGVVVIDLQAASIGGQPKARQLPGASMVSARFAGNRGLNKVP